MPAVQGLGKPHSPLYAGEGSHMSPGEEKLVPSLGGAGALAPEELLS